MMPTSPGTRSVGRTVLRGVVLVIAGTVVVVLSMLAGDLYRFLPYQLRRHPVGLALGIGSAAYAICRFWAARPGRTDSPVVSLRRHLDRLDQLADSALAGWMTVGVGAVCLGLLATWLPHYLLWPWSRDPDTFATIAQSWDAGILPYRDIRGYNFPGHIYLFWILGKLIGWGQTWAFYAMDAAALIALGVTLAAWSRRCLGGRLAGVLAFFLFLFFYLDRDYATVAQRDWHAPLCIVFSLLVLQGWPGRRARWLSAILTAVGLSIRPHVVMFMPALAAAVVEGVVRPGSDSQREESRPIPDQLFALGEWFLAVGLFTVLAFTPLMIAGIFDDLICGLRDVAYSGSYASPGDPGWRELLKSEISEPKMTAALALIAATMLLTRGQTRRRALTWALALLGALAYRLFHPVQHFYLVYPAVLVSSVVVAIPLGLIAVNRRVASPIRVAVMMSLIGEMIPGLPKYCSAKESLAALGSLVRAEIPPRDPPPGSTTWFNLARGPWYKWEHYRSLLVHLRETTGRSTMVANVLREPPYPPLNGPTARTSPFLAESGICWMLMVQIDLDREFAAALDRATDSVVVWAPEEHKYPSPWRLEHTVAVIRKRYRFAARFGRIEVWRRVIEATESLPIDRPD